MIRARTQKEAMGKVIVKIKLTNRSDVILNRAGARKARPRHAEVEALVGTGATRLYLKPSIIKKLGLGKVRNVISRTANGNVERGEFEEVNLELMGRGATLSVVEIPEDVPNLLGQVPLELLDFVVDPRGQRLLANPEHDGIQMTEVFLGR